MDNFSINKFIQLFNNFCEQHNIINDYGFGLSDDISAIEQQYPLVWIYNTSANFTYNITQVEFEVQVLDIVRDNQDNQIEVYSDTLQICQDIFTYFMKNSFADFEIEMDGNLTPIDAAYPDVCNGWKLFFTISFTNNLNVCDIPMNLQVI